MTRTIAQLEADLADARQQVQELLEERDAARAEMKRSAENGVDAIEVERARADAVEQSTAEQVAKWLDCESRALCRSRDREELQRSDVLGDTASAVRAGTWRGAR